MSVKTLFCSDWEFCKCEFGAVYRSELDFKPVDIPHDWLIHDTLNLYETSTGIYRKRFSYKKSEDTITSVRFEGVYMDTTVYLNGSEVGQWKYGYSTFEFDLTEYIKDGENELVVKVDHHSPNTRWYSGAGIYRKVYLFERKRSHILPDGIYTSTKKVSGGFELLVSTESARPQGIDLWHYNIRSTVYDLSGNEVASVTSKACACDRSCIDELVLKDGYSYSVTHQNIFVENPKLWDVEQGNLYTVKTELLVNGEVVDCENTRVGFKTFEFTTDNGFFINGKHLKLHGCCEHHDLGALGAAVNRAAIKRKLVKLRSMGINSIRTSHNMPAKEFMELCDEMGFLVVSEAFDMWERQKTEYDYARFFKQWVSKDVASWVRRDRNHASIIAWSIGNEIYDTHADDRGQEVTTLLYSLVRKNDYRANGYVTIGSNYMQGENAQKCADIIKLAGYNYGERLYDEHHKKHPDWMIYGSETASVVQSRGIYHFPLSKVILADDDEQCSSIGNCATAWGARNTEACIIPDRDAKYCAGQYIWTGFDYIGEPTPYSTKNSYFGQIDTAGFYKDSYYVFKSEWTDYKKAPSIHIFPHWDFNCGQLIDVRVTTNAPSLELFFNGRSLGKTHIDHANGKVLTGDYSLEYTPGELVAVAYDEYGKEIARDRVSSFGETEKFLVECDKKELLANGEDMIFVEISALDKDDNFVANANNRVNVTVSGAGRLLGLDNGDSTDYDQYKTTSRRLFSGKLLAMIGATDRVGDINVEISSKGLKTQKIKLTAVKSDIDSGVSFSENCSLRDAECKNQSADVPVRTVKLSCDNRELGVGNEEAVVDVEVLPANASYADQIEYRITTDIGIVSKVATITKVENGKVYIRANGDGEFFLRALCKNGTNKYHMISVLPFTAQGLGSALVDPYEFVTAGLFTVSEGKAINGIEQGMSFTQEKTWFGFENVDFGMAGGQRVTLPVYSNMNTPTRLWFYDGIPGEGGELIGEFEYNKPPKWLTYTPDTFTLTKRLKGIHTFVIMGMNGATVKGFEFEKLSKETAEIDAVDNLSIYGDKYTVNECDVTGIGNNVVLSFGEFDFEKAPSKLHICGKSALEKNSINLCVTKGGNTKRILIEFDGCAEYTDRVFDIEGVEGNCELSFTFLPGTDFDFKSFRFE